MLPDAMAQWMVHADLIGLLSVGILFVGYLLLWRAKRVQVHQATGRDPEVMGAADDRLQRYFAVVTLVMTLCVVLLIGLHGLGDESWWGLRRLWIFDGSWWDGLGLAMGIVGLLLCWVAQRTMGTAWRVGIDERHETGLVTHGIYARLRNPTHTGLFLLCGGFWLIWPTPAVACWVLMFAFFLEIQVRCEEQHLLTLHGALLHGSN